MKPYITHQILQRIYKGKYGFWYEIFKTKKSKCARDCIKPGLSEGTQGQRRSCSTIVSKAPLGSCGQLFFIAGLKFGGGKIMGFLLRFMINFEINSCLDFESSFSKSTLALILNFAHKIFLPKFKDFNFVRIL